MTIQIEKNWAFPPGFQFTQSNLQDFKDCPRRFYLRHIARQRWPAPLAEPQDTVEKALERGSRFHQLVERHQRGISANVLVRSIAQNEVLSVWFAQYQKLFDEMAPFERVWPEVSLSTIVGGYPLLAKYDLVGLQGKSLIALDWKTGNLPPEHILERRMQTAVYRLILYREAGRLAQSQLDEFVLRYVQIPSGDIYDYSVSAEKVDEVESQIRRVIEDVLRSDFDLVKDERPCRFCAYRGLCGRGSTPSLGDETSGDMDDLWSLDEDDSNPSVIEF